MTTVQNDNQKRKRIEDDDECCVCFRVYGTQIDGEVVSKDLHIACKHYCCADCCRKMVRMKSQNCPLCRAGWGWIQKV